MPTHCWGNHPSGNALTRKPKQNPPRTPSPCSDWKPSILHWKMHWCLSSPHRQKTEHTWDTLHFIPLTNHTRFLLIAPYQRKAAVLCTKTWDSIDWSKQLMKHFYRRSAAPNLRKQSRKRTQFSNWKSYSQTATSHLTTNCTTELSQPPWARNAILNPGTVARKLTTQQQYQHSYPFHKW